MKDTMMFFMIHKGSFIARHAKSVQRLRREIDSMWRVPNSLKSSPPAKRFALANSSNNYGYHWAIAPMITLVGRFRVFTLRFRRGVMQACPAGSIPG